MSNVSPLMLQIAYTPREDSNDRGYEDWLREIDMPFFNSVEGVIEYSNWKIVDWPVGTIRYTDYDLMDIAGPERWDAMVANQEMSDFALGWIKEWGQAPDGEMADNFQVNVAELIASP